MVWPYLVSPFPPVLHGGSSVRLSPATEPPRIAETCPQPEPVMAIENEGVTLNCMLRGNPRPTVVWTFRNDTVRAGDRFSFSNRRSQLTISEVEMGDGGVYTCTATNTAGQDVYEFLLEVQGRLLHSPSPSPVITFALPLLKQRPVLGHSSDTSRLPSLMLLLVVQPDYPVRLMASPHPPSPGSRHL